MYTEREARSYIHADIYRASLRARVSFPLIYTESVRARARELQSIHKESARARASCKVWHGPLTGWPSTALRTSPGCTAAPPLSDAKSAGPVSAAWQQHGSMASAYVSVHPVCTKHAPRRYSASASPTDLAASMQQQHGSSMRAALAASTQPRMSVAVAASLHTQALGW
jgi:hypothetical protein